MSEQTGSPAVAPGDIVGEKFQVGQMIGRGGMSVVYDARHIQLGQAVAVKVLNVHTATRAAFERILVEAQATARLTSEHVVRVIDVGTTKTGHGYVVMEKLVGNDLAAEIKKGTPTPIAAAVRFALEACHGLAEAHAVGIVHRDIKPSNLFLARKPDNTVTLKVLDFGLASAASTPSSPITARGSRKPRIAGSPGYASPEQLGTAGDVDARADVWGLGVVLYELVTGRRPFEATNLADALIAAATLPIPPMTSPYGPIPRDFEEVVRRCLQKDRENRFASVQDLATALCPFAPPTYSRYSDRVRAVAAKMPLSVGTLRIRQPDATATVGTFTTDTFSTEAPPSSAMPESSAMAESAAAASTLVTASVVPSSRLAIVVAFAALLLCGVLAGFFVMRRSHPQPAAAATTPSASVSVAVATSPSSLGPLPPLAAASAPETATSAPAVEVSTLPRAPVATHQRSPGAPKTAAPAASKPPAGNPMTYR